MKDKILVLDGLHGLCGRKATSKKMQSKTKLREQCSVSSFSYCPRNFSERKR